MQGKNLTAHEMLAVMHHVIHTFWEIDLGSYQVRVWHDILFPELEGRCLDYQTLYRHYIDKSLYPEDRDKWKRILSPAALSQMAEHGGSGTHIIMRFADHLGAYSRHELFYIVESRRVLLVSRKMDGAARDEAREAAAREEYDFQIYLDAVQNSYVMYEANAVPDAPLPPACSSDYEAEMAGYIRRHILPDERERLIEALRLDHIAERLKEREEYAAACTVLYKGTRRRKKLLFRRQGRGDPLLVMTCANLEPDLSGESRKEPPKRWAVQEPSKMLDYFEDMPVALCVLRVDVDAVGKPCDLVFSCVNHEMARLEGTTKENLINRSYYDFFPNGDKKWMGIYHKTAYYGVQQQFTKYSPEIARHLAVTTYQPEYGFCGCVVRDVTNELLMEIEVEKGRERDRLLLRNTTDAVFQFDLERRTIYNSEDTAGRLNLLPQIDDVPQGLLRNGMIREEGIAQLEDAIAALERGENSASCEILVKLNAGCRFTWYNITFSAYQEIYTGKRRVIGFLKNIDSIVLRRKKLEKAASTDALTQIYNMGAGRMLIENVLLLQEDGGRRRNAFFIIDIDKFKRINDSHGHDFGDTVLVAFAQTLKNAFREADIVFRLGGDEFAAFIEDIRSREFVERMCERIQESVRTIPFNGERITVSIGAYIGGPAQGYDEYYHNADAALYRVKGDGSMCSLVTQREDAQPPQ